MTDAEAPGAGTLDVLACVTDHGRGKAFQA